MFKMQILFCSSVQKEINITVLWNLTLIVQEKKRKTRESDTPSHQEKLIWRCYGAGWYRGPASAASLKSACDVGAQHLQKSGSSASLPLFRGAGALPTTKMFG